MDERDTESGYYCKIIELFTIANDVINLSIYKVALTLYLTLRNGTDASTSDYTYVHGHDKSDRRRFQYAGGEENHRELCSCARIESDPLITRPKCFSATSRCPRPPIPPPSPPPPLVARFGASFVSTAILFFVVALLPPIRR